MFDLVIVISFKINTAYLGLFFPSFCVCACSGEVANGLGGRGAKEVARVQDVQQARESREADAGARHQEGNRGSFGMMKIINIMVFLGSFSYVFLPPKVGGIPP